MRFMFDIAWTNDAVVLQAAAHRQRKEVRIGLSAGQQFQYLCSGATKSEVCQSGAMNTDDDVSECERMFHI